MAFSIDQFYRLNRRALIWIILFVLLYLLRDFFGIIFLTFVLSFIAAPMIRFGQRHLRLPRRPAIFVVYGCFLVALFAFAWFVPPRVTREANTLLGNLDQIEDKLIDLKNDIVVKHPTLRRTIPNYIRSMLDDKTTDQIDSQLVDWRLRLHLEEQTVFLREDVPSTDTATRAALGKYDDKEDELLIDAFMGEQAELLRSKSFMGLKLLGGASITMLLALLFSFLIQLDISRLEREVKSLSDSRLHDFYEETAQPVVRFAYVVGRAIQAQAMIACVNTVLTLIGMTLLGLPSLAMLALIVFLCSFVPVLGVFISTVPIVLVALNSQGLGVAGAAIGLVVVIHIIEAYLLNPLIYGKHLKLNPVIVLIILFVGHHMFGLWGMLLGVPVAHYFIHDVFGVPLWGERRLRPSPRALGAMQRQSASSSKIPPEEESAARADTSDLNDDEDDA